MSNQTKPATAEGSDTAPRNFKRLKVRKHSHYNVRPRYGAGSPAAVDFKTADDFAREEIDRCAIAASGVWGEKAQARAFELGIGPVIDHDGFLRSPAEYVEEHMGHWLVQCLCTGVLYTRPFYNSVASARACKRCLDARELSQAEWVYPEVR